MKAGRCSGMNWRRPGQSRKTWIQQIGDGTTTMQLETDVADFIGAWTSWRVVATRNGPQPSIRVMMMLMTAIFFIVTVTIVIRYFIL